MGESGEMQVELVGLQKCVSPGVWEEEWGTQWRRGGERGQQTGGGIWKQEVGARQGHGRRSVPAQRGTACRGGNTRHQQTGRKKAKPGHSEHPPRTHSTFLYANEARWKLTPKERKVEHSALGCPLNLKVT